MGDVLTRLYYIGRTSFFFFLVLGFKITTQKYFFSQKPMQKKAFPWKRSLFHKKCFNKHTNTHVVVVT